MKLSETQLAAIKRPLPAEAVTKHPTKQGLSSIKPIFITERLNEVFGVGQWRVKVEPLIIGKEGEMVITKTYTTSNGKERTEYFAAGKVIFEVPAHEIYYECMAGSGNDDVGDSLKGMISDNLGKIASWLGIGIDVFKGQHDQALKQEESRVKLEISKGVAQIKKCENVEQLKDVKAKLPEYVLNSKEFKEAATERFNQVSGKAA
jgi:hypothetical protein